MDKLDIETLEIAEKACKCLKKIIIVVMNNGTMEQVKSVITEYFGTREE